LPSPSYILKEENKLTTSVSDKCFEENKTRKVIGGKRGQNTSLAKRVREKSFEAEIFENRPE